MDQFACGVVMTRRSGQRWPTVAALLFVILGAAFVGFRAWADAKPGIVVPEFVMPSPNAFDYFVRAGKLANERIGSVSDTTYRLPTLSEKRLIVGRNGEALRILRQGFLYRYMNPPVRSFDAPLPPFGKFRSLARILFMDAEVKAADGQHRAAARDYLDTIQMGEMIPHGSTLIGRLVGKACEAIGREGLWLEVPHLNAAAAREAASRLQTLEAKRLPYAMTLQEEKWYGQAGLLKYMARPDWRKLLAQAVSYDEKREQQVTLLLLSRYSKTQILRNYTRYMDALMAGARLPYSRERPDPPVPDDPVSQGLDPGFTGFRCRDEVARAETSMLALSLALRAYHLEHASYPPRLKDLAPTYLRQIPTDPFAAGHPFRYRRIRGSYILYSVGPDGKDDGGIPAINPNATPPYRGSIGRESRGDIVAGVDFN